MAAGSVRFCDSPLPTFQTIACESYRSYFCGVDWYVPGERRSILSHLYMCWLPGREPLAKYRENGKKMREMLSVACSAGLSVAFGGLELQLVAFYFPTKYRRWSSSLCYDLRLISRTGNHHCSQSIESHRNRKAGSLQLFETNYGIDYDPIHYLVFIFLGICGGLFGEPPGGLSASSRIVVVTFGCKVPSGIIIPALDAGALFGRLIGQIIPTDTPGMFAMVGAAAFLAGVSRMTVSLAVIIFELTGEVDYIPPFMIAIMVAKWVADALSRESVYDLAQTVLGHPFLDPENALSIVRDREFLVEELIPPPRTMKEITLDVGPEFKVAKTTLVTKVSQLKARGLMDAGLVLVDTNKNMQWNCSGNLG
ncbi:uncharacterized protein RSE6_08823 [Rhynchosporium secalis]|uniref:Chloride channel protein n=1 Tax=Rhynchosporium secalis TaxID=38038 RepID=A0A1E1MGE7_RHYSE|nr:uncharacterized protein RSE6_08823 [Rhynchosporium secalis]